MLKNCTTLEVISLQTKLGKTLNAENVARRRSRAEGWAILQKWFYQNHMIFSPGKCHFMLHSN